MPPIAPGGEEPVSTVGPDTGGEAMVEMTVEDATSATAGDDPDGGRWVGTRTVLFTDVVSGTALRQRLGEEAADRLQHRHDEMLAGAVEQSRGVVVKGLGDGVLAVFESSADAVAAGVGAQRTVAAHGQQHPDAAFEIRVGISVGDVAIDDSDVHGSVVIEAARLCDAAGSGQVLVSDLVRALARGRGGFEFESVGELHLKGLVEPVPACRVDFELVDLTQLAGDAPVPFPGQLTPPTGMGYVGRSDLLDALTDGWQAAQRGPSQTVLVVGEPGAGKTRTASEVARGAFSQGAMVLYGRCDEELAVPYQPFAEALDWQTGHDPTLPLGRYPGDLVRLLPDLGRRVADLPAAVTSDRAFERHRLCEAVASWVTAVSAEQGLVLVLDDLHWATKPTVQLLTHVLRALSGIPEARVLVIAAYRDTDLDRTHPLSDALGELHRLPHVSRHLVDPLDGSEVAAFMEAAAGHALGDDARELAGVVSAETEGNPFFVGEVLRHFVETGAVRFEDGAWVLGSLEVLDVPEGVREVVGRRLSRLSPAANEMLRVAAVVGREVDVDVLGDLVEGGTDAVLDGLDEALQARLVVETGPDRLRFTHALVRSTLAGELSVTRRRRLHAHILDTLERRRPDDVAALAHHAVAAGPSGGDLTLAVGHSLAAGEHALAAGAAADALDRFVTALELIEEAPDVDVAQRLVARCGLGEAQRDAGDPDYRQTLLEVTHEALAAGAVELALRAALANGRVIASNLYAVDHERVAALDDVLDALGDDRPERAALLAAVAAELAQAPDAGDHPFEIAHEARAIAERSGDPALIARVAVATSFVADVADRPEALERIAAVISAADTTGDPLLRAGTRAHLVDSLLRRGRVSAVRTMLQDIDAIAEDATPTLRYSVRCFFAQTAAWEGDLDEARRRNDANLEVGAELGVPDALLMWSVAHIGLADATGELGELHPLLVSIADQLPGHAWIWVGVASSLLAAGRTDELRQLADLRPVTDPATIKRGMEALTMWTWQASLVRALDRRDDAAALLSILAPHRDHWAAVRMWLGLPVAVGLAECEAVAGDHPSAARSAMSAWHAVLDAGVRVHVPQAAVRIASVLTEVDTPDTRTEAAQVVEHALGEADAMGMERRVAQLDALRR